MGNKLTKSSAILMTALTLGTSTISTTQAVFAETGIVKTSEAEVNNADYKLAIKGFNLNNAYNATDKTIDFAATRFGMGLTIPDGSKVKKGDKITLNFQNYAINNGDILDKSGRKIATVKSVKFENSVYPPLEGNEQYWQGINLTNAGLTQTVDIVFEDISDLKNIDASFETIYEQRVAYNERDFVLPINVKDATGKILAEDKAFVKAARVTPDVPTYVKGSDDKIAATNNVYFNMNKQTATNSLVLANIQNSWHADKLKKGTVFEWNFEDPNFNIAVRNLNGFIDGKPIDMNQNFLNKVITGEKPLASIFNRTFTKTNKDGFLLAKPFTPKYIIKELTGNKLVIELAEDVPNDATLIISTVAGLNISPKKIDDTTVDSKTGNLLVKPTYKISYKNTATGVEETYDHTPGVTNQGTWANATGQVVKKSSTQLIGRIPGGKEVPITNTDPMEPGTPFSLNPKPIIVVDGKSYKPVDPKPVGGQTDPNVPKVFTNYEEVLPPTTTQKADPATSVVTTSTPTTKASTTTVTTKSPTTTTVKPATTEQPTTTKTPTTTVKVTTNNTTTVSTSTRINTVVQPATTKAPTTTVAPKKVTTYFKDPSGKDIVPPSEGDNPKRDIPGYIYVKTTVDPNGNVVHHYEPTKTTIVTPKKVTTYFKDDKGNEVKPPVEGDQPKLDIPGYAYVGTETDPDGNVIHKYRKVEVTSFKESKPLPKTGDASSLIGLIGTGLASVIGLVNFKRKK